MLGIYSAWAKVRRKRYFNGNTLLAGRAFGYHATGGQIFKGRLIAFAFIVFSQLVGLIHPFLVFAPTILLLIFLPWVITRMSGDLDAAEVGKIRIGQPVLVERRTHDAEIEGGIMSDHGRAVEIVDELLHHLRKLRRVLDITRANSVNRDVEGRKPHVPGADETFLDTNDLAVLNPRKPDGAGAAPLLIGGLEIDGDSFQE